MRDNSKQARALREYAWVDRPQTWVFRQDTWLVDNDESRAAFLALRHFLRVSYPPSPRALAIEHARQQLWRAYHSSRLVGYQQSLPYAANNRFDWGIMRRKKLINCSPVGYMAVNSLSRKTVLPCHLITLCPFCYVRSHTWPLLTRLKLFDACSAVTWVAVLRLNEPPVSTAEAIARTPRISDDRRRWLGGYTGQVVFQWQYAGDDRWQGLWRGLLVGEPGQALPEPLVVSRRRVRRLPGRLRWRLYRLSELRKEPAALSRVAADATCFARGYLWCPSAPQAFSLYQACQRAKLSMPLGGFRQLIPAGARPYNMSTYQELQTLENQSATIA